MYSEQGDIPASRICGSGVILSDDGDSEPYERLSFAVGIRRLTASQQECSALLKMGQCLFFREGMEMESLSASWGQKDAPSLCFVQKCIQPDC